MTALSAKTTRRRAERGPKPVIKDSLRTGREANAVSREEFEDLQMAPMLRTEALFTSWVIARARERGWLAHHVRPARRQSGRYSTPVQGDTGFPDLVLLRPGQALVRELKMPKGSFEPKQREWLAEMAAAGWDAGVWRPSDWREILKTLGPLDDAAAALVLLRKAVRR